MRTDPQRRYEFFDSEFWTKADLGLETFRPVDPSDPSLGYRARSFSGHERNRLFLQNDGNFTDATLVSGADFDGDSRNFVYFDFNRDGWLDIAVTSPLSPRFQLFKNNKVQSNVDNQAAFFTLEGGNHSPKPSSEWSARDAIGSKILVRVGETKRMYQMSCGEGLAVQNSRWIHVGMGKATKIDSYEVRWPSGKTTQHEGNLAGTRVILKESGETVIDAR